jgi:serine phosphatase RsbU (regulator of sigma subunit)/anti-sigma regulatory factor (Ser/Thr protein kinase)
VPQISPTGKRCDCLVTALELQIQADAYAPGRVRAELRRWLDARDWPEDDGEDLVLAVSEAVSNAAEHAYRGNDPAARDREALVAVVVTELIDTDESQVKAVVDDFGFWRSGPSDNGFRGHGLPLIGELMASYDVEHRRTGTRVTMISKPVAARPPRDHEPADRASEERLRWLEAVSDSGLAQLTVDQLLDELLEKVRGLMAVDTAAVLLLDPSRQFLLATVAKGIEEEVHQGVRIPLGRGFAGRIAEDRRWVAIEQVDHNNVLNPILREKGISSLLGVPLVAGGTVLGVLHVGTLTRRRFGEQDAELLQMVADRVAMATQSRMSQVDRAAAAVMRRNLLPAQLPDIAGFAFASRYVAGDDGEVGGDWYDVFALPSGAVCIVVGDVVGHGLAAAQSMSQVRAVLRATTLRTENPAEVLDGVDEHVRHFQPHTMATVLCGIIDPASDVLRMSSAGHPPPVLALPGDETAVVEIDADLPLGVELGHTRRNVEVPLPPGSVLCLYSDGLVERRAVLIDDNIEKLRRTVTRQPPESVCVEVMRRLVGVETPRDDVAVLVVERVA